MGMKAILVMIVTAGAVSGVPDNHGESAAERGSTIGAALLEVIQLQANTRMWEQPECADPITPEVKGICSAIDRAVDGSWVESEREMRGAIPELDVQATEAN